MLVGMADLSENPDYVFKVIESHLDTFGHMNNATYLRLFEDARWELMTSRGYSLKEVQSRKIGPVVLEIALKFKRELKNRETVRIRTSVLKHEGRITTVRQIMFNEKGEEACIGDFVFGLFDLSARKLIDYTPEWKAVLGL